MKKFLTSALFLISLLIGARASAASQEGDLRGKSLLCHYVQSFAANVSTNVILIDLSTITWPNPTAETGYINVTGITTQIDKAAASTESIHIGVINQVNTSTGSVSWFYENVNELNVSNTLNSNNINTDNAFRCLKVIPPSTAIQGVTPFLVTNSTITNSTIFLSSSTANFLNSTANVPTVPSVGDVVLQVLNGTGAIKVIVDILYHYEQL